MRRYVIAACVLFAACDDPKPLTYQKVQSDISTALLENWRMCGYAEAEFIEAESKLSASTRPALSSLFEILDTSVEDGRMRIDEDAFHQCLELLGGPGCVDAADLNLGPCARVFLGEVADGQPCVHVAECKDGLYCDLSAQACPGACRPTKAVGAVVSSSVECQRGLFFYGGKCAGYAENGQSCAPAAPPSNYQPCSPGLRCETTTSLCEPLAGVGAACLRDSNCEFGLSCTQESCVKRKGLGEACSLGASPTLSDCKLGGACVEGICQPYPKEGEACTGDCQPSLHCQSSLTGTGTTCRKFAAVGEACTVIPGSSFQFCDASGRCDHSSQTCVRPKANGESCTSSAECVYLADCVDGICAAQKCVQ